MNLKQRWSDNGYDLEELYFERLNRELIQKLQQDKGKNGQTSTESTDSEKGAQILAFPERSSEKKSKAA